jgi:hypothetical protein
MKVFQRDLCERGSLREALSSIPVIIIIPKSSDVPTVGVNWNAVTQSGAKLSSRWKKLPTLWG